MKIEKIRVVDRHRSDLGDLSDLAASIAMNGLLNPISVTTDLRLIAGQRRLEACRSLGWEDIDVRFIENIEDAAHLLKMERDENTCRKEMSPSECVALGRALEELEKPKAKAAQVAGLKVGDKPRSVLTNETGERERYDTREVVAPAVGMSTATYSRAKQLVTAAEAGDQVAAEAVQEMDRTGKVTKPYEAWKGHKVNRGPDADASRDSFGLAATATAERPAPKPEKQKVQVKKYQGRKPVAAMDNAVATLSGLAMPMKTLTAADFADLPDEVRTRWLNELAEVLSTLRRVRDLIKENS